ncbi:MAG: hypothetical protein AAFU56_11700, partial [Pseudomonadota bacterium]
MITKSFASRMGSGKARNRLPQLRLRAAAVFLGMLLSALSGLTAITPTYALEAVDVSGETLAIDLTGSVEYYTGTGNRIQVTTAPDANGLINRIEVFSESQAGSG